MQPQYHCVGTLHDRLCTQVLYNRVIVMFVG